MGRLQTAKSFEDVQAAYAVANQCSAMVSTAEARETPTLHGPVVKFRNDKDVVLQKEKYLKVILSRLGWSRHPSSLTVEDVCKVIRACLQSASALHAKQLVHRDFRYANVLWDIEGPFVIDLEMAATPPLKDPPMQLAWTPDTLDNGCFTFGSDVIRDSAEQLDGADDSFVPMLHKHAVGTLSRVSVSRKHQEAVSTRIARILSILSMARFGNVAELATFLGKLDVDYAEYAPALWQKGVKFPQQLANFSEPHYLACDVPEGHIDDIKARADTTGRNSTEGEAGPSKKPWTGHITVPQLPGRWPLYSEIERENSILLMEGTTVLKQIENFKKYEDRQMTCLAAIKRAYAAAGRAANEAKRTGNPQYLVTCASPPRLVKTRFEVRTLPCGYASHVFSEQDLHAVAKVQKKHVPCEIATFEDLLGTCHKDRRLLPDLRYLQLLLAKPSQLRKEISKLINMRLTRPISPHVDSELEYHPITLALFQFAALGQHGLCFQQELHDVNDSAREDIRCCIDGEPLEPSEIKASEFYPTTKDPDGIHSNSAGLSKIYKRNQLLNTTTTAMTAIKMHHTQKGNRKVKPERDIQAVLQKKEDFQRLETLAIADAVAEEVKENEAQDECQKFKVCKRICISSEVICVLSADSRSIHQLRGRLAWLEEGWDDPDDLPGPEEDPLRIKIVCPPIAGLSLSDQLFRERFRQELELVNAEPPSKRSRTACQEYSTLPTADCDEVKLWIAEVQKKHVPCEIATFEDLLGTCHKDRRLLPDLRYLQLLLAKPSQLRKEISKLINMRLTRPISPHVDSELEYHPITLALFQFAALGQHGLCFQQELHDVNDSAREDIRCCIDGEPLEPSEIKASEFYPTTKDPDGIHSNSAGLSKIYK
ncbi:hypothetical protein WJX82_010134 [Trebouxia sp. C0006]